MKTTQAYSYIRFSSSEQAKGDSLRRQLEASEKYAREHGLTLNDSLNLRDLGLSAFHGVHRTKGALGEFLRLVEAGKIENDSILIVENLDRLSREQVLDALNQFTSIIKAGIKIVTLHDGQEYDQKSINANWTQLIISITYMARAYDESLRKSQRLSASWQQKRKQVNSQKLTAKAPAWLRLSEDRTHFITIPDVCHSIETIYKMKLSGAGSGRIERELNQRHDIWKPPVSNRNKSGGWRKSYINKLLMNNRELIGEYQPYRKIEGRRITEGIPIKNYFPSAISEDLFYSVQSLIQKNRQTDGNGGGKTGKATNLFIHVAKCGLCGSAMHFIDKGTGSKGGQYLVCDHAHRKTGDCAAKPIRYDEFLHIFFDDFEELEIEHIVPSDDGINKRINELRQLQSVQSGRLLNQEKQIQNLTNSIKTTSDSRVRKTLEDELSKVFDERTKEQNGYNESEQGIKELSIQKDELRKSIDQTQEVYRMLESSNNEQDIINIRLRLRAEIQRLVEWIKIYPLQEKYVETQEIEPGIIKSMYSRYIDKVRINFRGTGKIRILYLKCYGEVF